MNKKVLTDEEYKDLQNAGIKLTKEELEKQINDNLKFEISTKIIDTFPDCEDWDKMIKKAKEVAEFLNSIPMTKKVERPETRQKEEWEVELEEDIKRFSKELEENMESHPIFYDTITF